MNGGRAGPPDRDSNASKNEKLKMSSLLVFFGETPKIAWLKLLVVSVGSALCNAAILIVINKRITEINATEKDHILEIMFFVTSVAVFGIAHKTLISSTVKVVEDAINAFRTRIFQRICSLELREIEKLDINGILTCINTETQVVSDATFAFAMIGEQALIVFFTLAYIASVSLIVFCAAALFILVSATLLIQQRATINKSYQLTLKLESNYTEKVSELLHGFKEVKLNYARAVELADITKSIAQSIRIYKIKLNKIFAKKHIYSEICYFIFLGSTVLVVPMISGLSQTTIAMAAVSALFLIGPTITVVSAIPLAQKIAASTKAIYLIEQSLGDVKPVINSQKSDLLNFHEIVLSNVYYNYDDGAGGFRFGGISLTIGRGEVVFITGSNGTGKSTLLKLIAGLYFPTSGHLSVDDRQITADNIESYRELFCAVFSDNYIFKTLYGIPEVDGAEATEILRKLEIEHKTNIEGRRFSTIHLSSGQRKRIALAALILEKRPICVFDEWAADQDSYFRNKFYSEILPWLKSIGKTVIVVTHDENVFGLADKHINLNKS